MKRLVFCLDGTWNRPDQEGNPSNVTAILRAIPPADADGTVQLVFYDKGVGTGGPLNRMVGGLFGKGLRENIRDAYRALVNNYEPGDEIYLFGFSRGAFTARSLAGMIGEVGVLENERVLTTGDAWQRYLRASDDPERPAAIATVREHSRCDVRISAVGVWDTVGALGIPDDLLTWAARRSHGFHDTAMGAHIDRAFHALAIDERRGPFRPTLWRSGDGRGYATTADGDLAGRPLVEQVWFAGVHTDVGGGYDEDALARIPLDWMVRRLRQTTGLAVAPPRATLDSTAPQHESRDWKYLFSRVFPFVRPLADGLPPLPFRKRLRAERHLDRVRGKPINEMVHRSVLERRGRQVAVRRGTRTLEHVEYAPPTLARADDRLPVVEHDGTITPAG